MKLRLAPVATRNISETADYLRTYSPGASQRVSVYLRESLQNLLLFPLAGRAQRHPGVRKFVTPRRGYIVY